MENSVSFAVLPKDTRRGFGMNKQETIRKAWAEREDTKKRSKSGIKTKRDKGEYKGGRPKGKRDTKKRERRWKVKPDIKVEDLVL